MTARAVVVGLAVVPFVWPCAALLGRLAGSL
jgi:hypothetical protein